MAEVRPLDPNELDELSKHVRALLSTGFTGQVILHCRAGVLKRVERRDTKEWPLRENGTAAHGLDKRASIG